VPKSTPTTKRSFLFGVPIFLRTIVYAGNFRLSVSERSVYDVRLFLLSGVGSLRYCSLSTTSMVEGRGFKRLVHITLWRSLRNAVRQAAVALAGAPNQRQRNVGGCSKQNAIREFSENHCVQVR